MNYLCVGNIACDLLAHKSGKQKHSNRRIYLDQLTCTPGGDALNSAVDASIMGVQAKLIGRIGQDLFGQMILQKIKNTKIDLSMLRMDPTIHTSVSFYTVTQGGEKDIALYRPGGNEALEPEDVPDCALQWADHLHLGSPMIQDGLDGGGNAVLLQRAKRFGVQTSMDLVYDPDEIWLPKIEEALSYCDIFIPSDYEVSKMCGTDDLEKLTKFFEPYGLKIFGVKLGKRGVYLTDFHDAFLMPSAYRGLPVETLGAGDAFFAAFNIAYYKKEGIYRSAMIASCASACVLGHFGANTGMVTYEQLKRLADDFKTTLERGQTQCW